LLRTQRSILVKCNLNTEIELTCSRCAISYQQPLKIKFNEEFYPTIDVDSGAPLPWPEEASSFTIDEQHILDLTEAVRQYISRSQYYTFAEREMYWRSLPSNCDRMSCSSRVNEHGPISRARTRRTRYRTSIVGYNSSL